MAKKTKKNKSSDFIKIEEKEKKDNKSEIKLEESNKEKKNVAIKLENPKNKLDVSKNKIYKHSFINGFLVFVLLTSLLYFIVSLFYNNTDSIATLISCLLLMIFTLLFVTVSISTNRKNKNGFLLSGLVLLSYFIFNGLITMNIINFQSNKIIDFTNMELTEVIKWSEKNKIDIVQDYEFSDMIEEYHIISQDVPEGTKLKAVDSITVAVSEGPNPSKEVILPNMIGWDSERVLEFIKKNYLSNVDVEFIKSTSKTNTIIEQSISGNVKRDEKIKLIFSYGEELGFEEVKLKDLSRKSKFEALFYLKQHHLNYEFEEVFSNKVKRGYVVKQNIKAGTMVKVNGDKVIISISKGPEIKVPNLKSMSMSEITEWVIKNKLKLEFTDKYDDSIEENSVISANYKENDIIAEGTVIKVVISRGKLKMPSFKDYNEFKEWAEKYSVSYEEQREFSNTINIGEVIRYSYKTGDTIKNNDSIIVTISDGKETSVPSVTGLSKDAAATKLKNAGFNYNFVYSYSSNIPKGSVVKQSISAGSKVSQGTTITVTISNGPRPANSSGGGSSSGGSAPSAPSTPVAPTPTCNPVEVVIQSALNGGSVAETSNNYRQAYPNVKFNFVPKSNAYGSNGMVHPDTTTKRVLTGTTCDTFTIYIIQN